MEGVDRDPAGNSARRILYVEDSPADLALVEEAMRTVGIPVALERVADGESALERIGEAPPHLVLIDLHLPGEDGVRIVERLRADARVAVRRTPVVMLTTSGGPEDVGRAYDAGVNCFIDKPIGFEAFSHAIAAVLTLWLEVVTVPARA